MMKNRVKSYRLAALLMALCALSTSAVAELRAVTRSSSAGTNFSCATANGVSCSVDGSNVGTFTLGAITPTTVNGVTFTGSGTAAFGSGGTVAYTANNLGVFASTTSAQLAGIISDETGSAGLVFANTPTLVTPILGAATGTSFNGLALSISANDTTAGGTILIGTSAGANLPSNAAYGDFFAGYQAGQGSVSTTIAAVKNTGIGFQAMNALTTGVSNTAIGWQAMLLATSGIDATAVGSGACAAFTTANLNTCVGFNSGNTTTGAQNTLIGAQSGDFISSGSGNTAVGYNAMLGATGNKITGSNNTAIGQTAMLAAITTAAGNTVIGQAAANKLTTGGTNVIIGQGVASTTLTTGSGNILIGNSSVIDAATNSTSNTLVLGNNATTPVISSTSINSTPTTTLNGIVNMPGLSSSSAATTGTVCWTTVSGLLNVDTTTTCLLSAMRFKKEIKDSEFGLEEVMKMRPRTFKYDIGSNEINLQRRQVGFVAEEMYKVVPELVSLEPNGKDLKSVAYQNLTAVLVKAIQEQQKQIDRIENDRSGHRCYLLFWCSDNKNSRIEP